MLKILTILGARPQFIKASTVSREIKNNYNKEIAEVILHTGQHFDRNMSEVFFSELDIPTPNYNLKIAGGGHGSMTGRMLEGIEAICLKELPDLVLVYGDTNSTLAGALAAVKLKIPIGHIEAGLRSNNLDMPEEVNRILVDRISRFLFCPSEEAVKNLCSEGQHKGVINLGDVMYDAAIHYGSQATQKYKQVKGFNLEQRFALCTCHRAENTNDPKRLSSILKAMNEIAKWIPVVFPIHPRTQKSISDYGLERQLEVITVIEPASFLEMLALEQTAQFILTDSGGIQKEAFFFGKPCITMRDESEWVETIALGANKIVGANTEAIISAAQSNKTFPLIDSKQKSPYGDGAAAVKIVKHLKKQLS